MTGINENSENSFAILPDEPIGSKDEDQFHHSSLVAQLLHLIESTRDHFNIGVFGRWGTGKTGILRMLNDELEKDPYSETYDYIYIDAWKLSKDSLLQQILFELSRKLDPEKSEEEIADRLFHTTEETIKEEQETWTQALSRVLREASIYFLLSVLIVAGALVVDSFYPGRNLLPIISAFFVIPLIAGLMNRIAQASRAATKSTRRIIPRIESPFQFDQMFKEMIGKRRRGKQTVIALDNLDRCESELAVGILSTVKTFMETEGVVFVVACDDNALVKHIKNTKGLEEEDAREFLRKFFQSSITIPAAIEGDILEYVDGLTPKLAVPVPEGVKEVLIAATIDNPRRIKQSLNNYAMNHLLASVREKDGVVGKGVLTGRADFLAKIAVIRDKFPRFYESLTERDDLLARIESHFRNEPLQDIDEAEITRILDENPGLEWFLQRTRTIEVPDVTPFIRVAQETYESTLPEHEELKLKVRANDYQYVTELLEKSDERRRTNIVRLVLSTVDADMKRKRPTWAFNGLNVLLETVDKVPVTSREQAVDALQRHVWSPDMLSQLPRFRRQKMFPVLHEMEAVYRDSIVAQYCRLVVKDGSADRRLLQLIISNRELVSPDARRRLNDAFASLMSSNEDQGQEMIRAIAGIKDAKTELLTSRTALAIASTLKKDDSVERNKSRAELFREVKEVADSAATQKFVVRLLELLPESPPNQVDDETQFVLDELDELRDEDIRPPVVGRLFDALSNHADAMPNEDEKVKLFPPLIRHISKLPEDQQDQFLEQQLNPLLESGSESIVLELLVAFSDSGFNPLRNESILETLVERAKTDLAEPQLLSLLLDESLKHQKSSVADMLIENISSGDASLRDPTLEAFGTDGQRLPRSEVDRVCTSIIENARAIGSNEKQAFYDALIEAYPACSQDTQENIVDEILELVKQGDPMRSWGIEYYKGLRSRIPRERRLHVLRQLINDVLATPIDQVVSTVELIQDDQEVLEQGERVRLIDYLHGEISTAKPESTQIHAMESILRLGNLYNRGKGILKDVLRLAKSTGNERVRELGKKIHEEFGRYKVPDEHWKDAREVFGDDIRPE